MFPRMTLSDYLDKAGVTEAEFAVTIGYSQATVSKLKSGRQWPGLYLLMQVVWATGGEVTANDFFTVASSRVLRTLRETRDSPRS